MIITLTARNLHRTGLGVQGIELEIHGTREGQRDSDAEQNRACKTSIVFPAPNREALKSVTFVKPSPHRQPPLCPRK